MGRKFTHDGTEIYLRLVQIQSLYYCYQTKEERAIYNWRNHWVLSGWFLLLMIDNCYASFVSAPSLVAILSLKPLGHYICEWPPLLLKQLVPPTLCPCVVLNAVPLSPLQLTPSPSQLCEWLRPTTAVVSCINLKSSHRS